LKKHCLIHAGLDSLTLVALLSDVITTISSLLPVLEVVSLTSEKNFTGFDSSGTCKIKCMETPLVSERIIIILTLKNTLPQDNFHFVLFTFGLGKNVSPRLDSLCVFCPFSLRNIFDW
jgi:hypothetical protein